MKRRALLLLCVTLSLGVTFAADPAAKKKPKKEKLHYTFCNTTNHSVTVELTALGFDQNDSSKTYKDVIPAGKTLSFVAKVVNGPGFDVAVDVIDNGIVAGSDTFAVKSDPEDGWIQISTEKLVMSYGNGHLFLAKGPL